VFFQSRRPADGIAGTLTRLGRMMRPDEITHAGVARAVFVLAVVATSTAITAQSRRRVERLASIWFAIIVVAFVLSPTWWEQYSPHLAAVFALLSGLAGHALVAGVRAIRAKGSARTAALVALAGVVLLAAFVVDSSHYEAEHGDNPAVRKFAASMAKVQRSEINEINDRRVAIGLAAVPRSEIDQLETVHPGE